MKEFTSTTKLMKNQLVRPTKAYRIVRHSLLKLTDYYETKLLVMYDTAFIMLTKNSSKVFINYLQNIKSLFKPSANDTSSFQPRYSSVKTIHQLAQVSSAHLQIYQNHSSAQVKLRHSNS